MEVITTAIAEKISKIIGELEDKDWKTDKEILLNGRHVPVISTAKVKGNLRPILAKHKVCVRFDIDPDSVDYAAGPNGSDVTMTVVFTAVDVEDGSEMTTRIPAYGTGKFAIKSAITWALNSYLSVTFMVGMDAEDGEGTTAADIIKSNAIPERAVPRTVPPIKTAPPKAPSAPAKSAAAPKKDEGNTYVPDTRPASEMEKKAIGNAVEYLRKSKDVSDDDLRRAESIASLVKNGGLIKSADIDWLLDLKNQCQNVTKSIEGF